MSSGADSSSAAKAASMKPTKVVIPKVWKRPHSTIYGKNVEFGSKLTSDKLGEINGRKFNSELPWQMRNSGGSSGISSSSGLHQGYLSKLLNEPESTLLGSVVRSTAPTRGAIGSSSDFLGGGGSGGSGSGGSGSGSGLTSGLASGLMSESRREQLNAASCANFADVLEVTNPNRYSKRRRPRSAGAGSAGLQEAKNKRIDFYENYLEFNNEVNRLTEPSPLMEGLLHRRPFDKNLDFNHELGLFVPSSSQADLEERSLARKRTLQRYEQQLEAGHVAAAVPHLKHADCDQNNSNHHYHNHARDQLSDINNSQYLFNPVITTTLQTHLLPRHDCQLASSPYGQSADGRKLSLGSINPHSYRPSLPHKTSTVHASDGEEFEFQDRSSPFYTDR